MRRADKDFLPFRGSEKTTDPISCCHVAIEFGYFTIHPFDLRQQAVNLGAEFARGYPGKNTTRVIFPPLRWRFGGSFFRSGQSEWFAFG